MGQIEDLRTFIAVVDAGGVARGAEVLRIAKSAVSRRLSLLEDRYATRLIDRQPGLWRVTTSGQELYERAARLVSEADEIDADFKEVSHHADGPLAVSVAQEFGLTFLQPALLAFQEGHPEIQLTIDFDDRHVDLDRENYDLAIRVTEDVGAGFEVRRIGHTRHGLYASPGYAAASGLSTSIEELKMHPLLFFGAARRAAWDFIGERGKQRLEFQPALNSNSGQFLLEAARNGRGIARLPDFIATPAHAVGDLVQVLPDLVIATWDIGIVSSTKRRFNRRMRLFCNEITSACLALG